MYDTKDLGNSPIYIAPNKNIPLDTKLPSYPTDMPVKTKLPSYPMDRPETTKLPAYPMDIPETTKLPSYPMAMSTNSKLPSYSTNMAVDPKQPSYPTNIPANPKQPSYTDMTPSYRPPLTSTTTATYPAASRTYINTQAAQTSSSGNGAVGVNRATASSIGGAGGVSKLSTTAKHSRCEKYTRRPENIKILKLKYRNVRFKNSTYCRVKA